MLCVKSENVSFPIKRKCFHQKLFLSREILATHIFDIHFWGKIPFLLSQKVTSGCAEVLINACLGDTEGTHVSLCSPDRH